MPSDRMKVVEIYERLQNVKRDPKFKSNPIWRDFEYIAEACKLEATELDEAKKELETLRAENERLRERIKSLSGDEDETD